MNINQINTKEILKNSDTVFLIELATSTKDREVLEKLSNSDNKLVKAAVVINKETTNEILLKLAKTNGNLVLTTIAEKLDQRSDYWNYELKIELLKNGNDRVIEILKNNIVETIQNGNIIYTDNSKKHLIKEIVILANDRNLFFKKLTNEEIEEFSKF